MRFNTFPVLPLILALFILSSCKNTSSHTQVKDQMYQAVYSQVRLGDGVPLTLDLSLRWTVNDPDLFFGQFDSLDHFNRQVLNHRIRETLAQVSNEFESVDSVFSSQREFYTQKIKETVLEEVGEEGVTLKEAILSDITFPKSYTDAMSEVGLQRQELERIKQRNIVDLERAAAQKQKAAADGEVAIAKAKAEGELQKIQAKTEESRRKIELAKAETAAQTDKKMAAAEAERLRLIAKAERDKQRDLKAVDAQHKRDLMQIEIDKQRNLDKVELAKQIDFAEICTANPTYASFLVNKELASHVEIAVLPQGGEGNGVLGNFLKGNSLPSGN